MVGTTVTVEPILQMNVQFCRNEIVAELFRTDFVARGGDGRQRMKNGSPAQPSLYHMYHTYHMYSYVSYVVSLKISIFMFLCDENFVFSCYLYSLFHRIVKNPGQVWEFSTQLLYTQKSTNWPSLYQYNANVPLR